MLDRIAGQAVCLPVLTAVAIVLARRRRSWRPIVIALLAEVGFLGGVGTLKVLLGRGASSTGDTRFFEACLLEMGTWGISFPPPSGHAAEAVRLSAEARAPAAASAPAGAEQRCAAAPARDGPTRG